MDEYSADPIETEREAQRVLKKIETNKARAEVSDIAEKEKAEKAAERTYTKNYKGNTRAGGGGGGADLKSLLNPRNITYKKGGAVSSASKRADGIAIRGKTRA